MNGARYDELVSRLLDGEISDAEAGELAALVRDHPGLRRDLRHHLQLWELWSQQQAPERSPEAFLAALRTRLRAEREGESFVTAVRRRLRRDAEDSRDPGSAQGAFRRWFWRPAGLAWAASLATIVVVAGLWLFSHTEARATTLHGEAICTRCMLRETHDHLPALRVREGDVTRIYRVQCSASVARGIGNYCAAPVPVVATGRTTSRDGLLLLEATAVASEAPPAKDEERVLFPF